MFDEILKEQEVENSDLKENFSSKLCKTLSNSFSIKSGKRLTQEEMRLLIEELLKCDTPTTSPFGLNTYFNVKTEEINKLLFTSNYLCFNGSDISATFVKPEPDNRPIISSTLP